MTNGSGVALNISVRIPDDWSLDDSVPSTLVSSASIETLTSSMATLPVAYCLLR